MSNYKCKHGCGHWRWTPSMWTSFKKQQTPSFLPFRRILSMTQYYHTCNCLIDFYSWCLSSVLSCVISTRNKWSCLTSCSFPTLLRSSVTDLVLSVHFTFSSFSSGGVCPLMIHFKTDCVYFTHPTLLVITRPDSFFHVQEILK